MSDLNEEDCSNVSIGKRNKQIENGVDRISSLPDNILVSILSLLSIHSAAATSVLSRRWRHLWTHITHIRLPRTRIFHQLTKVNSHHLISIIDHIFSQLNSPKIHSFQLSCDVCPWETAAYKQEDISVFVPWIHHICARNPEVIEFHFPFFGVGHLPEVPSNVLETQSLVDLRLTGYFKVPDHTKLLIDLPNLKTLHLSFSFSNYSLIGMLSKCCPLLEDLSLSMRSLKEQEAYFVDITALNLKRLLIEIYDSSYSSNKHTFVIDAPMLEYCDMRGDLVFYDFLKSPSNLLEVKMLILGQDYDNNNSEYCTKVLQLFSGICWVKSLVLKQWEGPLLCFLSELDSVETLAFHNLVSLAIERDDEDQRDWEQFPCFPLCLLANLKQLKITNLMGTNLEIEMLQHILSHAHVMEHVFVSICYYYENRDYDVDQLRKEYNFCTKLFMLPKCSKRCEIEFSGMAIKASSKDFINGALNCQITRHENYSDPCKSDCDCQADTSSSSV